MRTSMNDRFNLIFLFSLVLAVTLIDPAFGKDLIVDGKNPAAKDDNPGTLEAPFKTIQAAMDKAQAGDSVQVRAGVYPEGVTFKRGGSYPGGAIETWSPRDLKWLTLEAYKDEHVVLEGAVTIPADKWELVKGCKNTYSTPFVSEEGNGHKVNMVFRDGTLISPTLKNVQGKNSSLIEGGMANSVLEALAYGKALLATDIEGNRSIVKECVTGLLYRDAGEFRVKAEQLVTDPQLRERLGKNGRALVRDNYPPEKEAQAYLELYHSILNG